MRTEITAGQTSDYLGFDLVMADNLPEPSVLLADRGYDSDNIRKTMEVRDVVPVIPMRKTRKLRVAVDRRLYVTVRRDRYPFQRHGIRSSTLVIL